LYKIFLIGIGGFFGSIARFVFSKYINNYFSGFPAGTLFVNVTGSFILGLLLYLVASGKNISPEVRDLIAIGFIGAYTTMSTFAYESFRIGELSEWLILGLNIFLNLFLCLLAVYLGRELAFLISK